MTYTKFRSVEEFREAVKQERIQSLRQQIDDIFEKSLRSNFDSIPVGSFKSNLPEIKSISFVHPEKGKGSRDVVYAVIFSVDKKGREVHHTWLISKNGHIYPKDEIPPALSKYNQEEIAFEIVSLLEKISPSFIFLTDLDIIPLSDEGEAVEKSSIKFDHTLEENPIDPEREQFLQSQKGALFQMVNRELGFKGYTGLLFRSFIYLDNLNKGNAAFILDLQENIDVKKIRQQLLSEKLKRGEKGEISEEEIRREIVNRYWGPVADKAKTKKELMILGAQRIVHTPNTWKEKVKQVIEARINDKTTIESQN